MSSRADNSIVLSEMRDSTQDGAVLVQLLQICQSGPKHWLVTITPTVYMTSRPSILRPVLFSCLQARVIRGTTSNLSAVKPVRQKGV
jgi:hypothetical protein